jgi:hypothetical protein
VFQHACKLGLEGIVSKHKNSRYVSGRSLHWIKSKNPHAPAVKREADIDWAAGSSANVCSSRRSSHQCCGAVTSGFDPRRS